MLESKTTDMKLAGVDWALVASTAFWIFAMSVLITIINAGRVKIPQSVLEVTITSAESAYLTLAHHGGDPVRFANTRCIWTPDITVPDNTADAGPLILSGPENKQGCIAKFEPGERAGPTNAISLQAGQVGRLTIADLKSGRLIFSRRVHIQ